MQVAADLCKRCRGKGKIMRLKTPSFGLDDPVILPASLRPALGPSLAGYSLQYDEDNGIEIVPCPVCKDK